MSARAVALAFLLSSFATGAGAQEYVPVNAPRSVQAPRVAPPSPGSDFARAVDLPQIGRYQEEVLRISEGGFFPATVIQLAVIAPGQPVQMLVIRAGGYGHWQNNRRRVSTLAWADYAEYRRRLFTALSEHAAIAATTKPLPFGICTDDGQGAFDFGGGQSGLGIELQIGCMGDPAAIALRDDLLALAGQAEHAAPAPIIQRRPFP